MMNRRWLIVAALAAALAGTTSAEGWTTAASAAEARDYAIAVDGRAIAFPQPPIERGGRLLVPLRGVFEALGAAVQWEAAAKRVTVVKGKRTIVLTVQAKTAVIDGVRHELDAAPVLVNGYVMVPLRFVAEALGAGVQWDTGAVEIVSSEAAAGSGGGNAAGAGNSGGNAAGAGGALGGDGANGAAAGSSGGNAAGAGGAQGGGGGRQDGGPDAEPFAPLEGDGMYPLTDEEKELAKRINAYRKELGLAPFQVSKSLTKVARYHVYDSNTNGPPQAGCNLHSWSDSGSWTGGCYTPDHANAELMWDKPQEITDGTYSGAGFEISYWNSDRATPSNSLEGWIGSPGHNSVIAGEGSWSALKVMGVAVYGEYAHVWFGEEEDPNGYYEL